MTKISELIYADARGQQREAGNNVYINVGYRYNRTIKNINDVIKIAQSQKRLAIVDYEIKVIDEREMFEIMNLNDAIIASCENVLRMLNNIYGKGTQE